MKQVLLAICCTFLLGCNVRPEETVDAVSYFNIEELLNNEIGYLLEQNAGLEKTVNSNGQKETVEIEPSNKKEWEAQLSLFFEANIDKLGLRDAYHEEELSPLNGMKNKIYSAKSRKNFVQTFEVLYNDDLLRQINIQTQEKNEVYTNNRSLNLYFDRQGVHIIGFDISGKEDMRMKEPMSIDIKAVVTF